MTNEEIRLSQFCEHCRNYNKGCGMKQKCNEADAYEMALDEKDLQFKEYLEKKRGIFLSRAVELYDSTDTMASAYNNARLKLLDEIINELFKED